MADAAQGAIENDAVPLDAAPLDAAASQKISRRKLIIVLAAATLLLAAVSGAAWMFLRASPADVPDEDELKPAQSTSTPKAGRGARKSARRGQPSVFMKLETFTVNLQSDAGDRFLQTTIVFELSDDEVAEKIKAQMPVIRSRLLLLLSSRKPQDLITLQGKDKLAEDIIGEARKHFNAKPPEHELLEVHFNSFVIQ